MILCQVELMPIFEVEGATGRERVNSIFVRNSVSEKLIVQNVYFLQFSTTFVSITFFIKLIQSLQRSHCRTAGIII